MSTATVVGSGPNGLAAAIVLAEAGLEVTVVEARDAIGGGTRTAELTEPGLLHDVCSAAHPFAVASPFFRDRDFFRAESLELAQPEIPVAHPLDGAVAGHLSQSFDESSPMLSQDARRWQQLFGPLVESFGDVADDVLRPLPNIPKHPVLFARFGMLAGLSGRRLAKLFGAPETQALLAGNAAHIMRPLTRPATASVGTILTAAAHAVGWPVPVGGSAAIAQAMADRLIGLGGRVETGREVSDIADLDADVVMLDISPAAVLDLYGDRLPSSVSFWFRRWKNGPAAWKIDLALDGDIPWQSEICRRAGTVHVGGTLAEVVHAEQQIHRGVMPDRPFVLVGQQYLADPSRSRGSTNPIWMYAHVPNGYSGDATEVALNHVERFAPGFRERILRCVVSTPAGLQEYNPNFRGGDILTGANNVRQLVFRPRPALDPYYLGVEGHYLCSAATPPGAGVHGMCGHFAAQSALKRLGHGG